MQGSLLWVLYNQGSFAQIFLAFFVVPIVVSSSGVQCQSCSCNVHARCKGFIGNMCGLDVEQMASELSKMGTSSERLLGTVPSKEVSLSDCLLLNASFVVVGCCCCCDSCLWLQGEAGRARQEGNVLVNVSGSLMRCCHALIVHLCVVSVSPKSKSRVSEADFTYLKVSVELFSLKLCFFISLFITNTLAVFRCLERTVLGK